MWGSITFTPTPMGDGILYDLIRSDNANHVYKLMLYSGSTEICNKELTATGPGGVMTLTDAEMTAIYAIWNTNSASLRVSYNLDIYLDGGRVYRISSSVSVMPHPLAEGGHIQQPPQAPGESFSVGFPPVPERALGRKWRVGYYSDSAFLMGFPIEHPIAGGNLNVPTSTDIEFRTLIMKLIGNKPLAVVVRAEIISPMGYRVAFVDIQQQFVIPVVRTSMGVPLRNISHVRIPITPTGLSSLTSKFAKLEYQIRLADGTWPTAWVSMAKSYIRDTEMELRIPATTLNPPGTEITARYRVGQLHDALIYDQVPWVNTSFLNSTKWTIDNTSFDPNIPLEIDIQSNNEGMYCNLQIRNTFDYTVNYAWDRVPNGFSFFHLAADQFPEEAFIDGVAQIIVDVTFISSDGISQGTGMKFCSFTKFPPVYVYENDEWVPKTVMKQQSGWRESHVFIAHHNDMSDDIMSMTREKWTAFSPNGNGQILWDAIPVPPIVWQDGYAVNLIPNSFFEKHVGWKFLDSRSKGFIEKFGLSMVDISGGSNSGQFGSNVLQCEPLLGNEIYNQISKRPISMMIRFHVDAVIWVPVGGYSIYIQQMDSAGDVIAGANSTYNIPRERFQNGFNEFKINAIIPMGSFHPSVKSLNLCIMAYGEARDVCVERIQLAETSDLQEYSKSWEDYPDAERTEHYVFAHSSTGQPMNLHSEVIASEDTRGGETFRVRHKFRNNSLKFIMRAYKDGLKDMATPTKNMELIDYSFAQIGTERLIFGFETRSEEQILEFFIGHEIQYVGSTVPITWVSAKF